MAGMSKIRFGQIRVQESALDKVGISAVGVGEISFGKIRIFRRTFRHHDFRQSQANEGRVTYIAFLKANRLQ